MSLETLKGGIPMSNRNYTNYSKQNKPAEKAPEAPESQSDENVQNIQENIENTEPATNAAPEPQPEPETPEAVIGVVVNCEKLNIRADANKTAEVLCIINKGEEVEIDEEDSTDDFYAVIYGGNKSVSVIGFCMKQYIEINK
jgi:hypothetical protein